MEEPLRVDELHGLTHAVTVTYSKINRTLLSDYNDSLPLKVLNKSSNPICKVHL